MTKEHLEIAAWAGGYGLFVYLTPWAIPIGIIVTFGYLAYNGGYF